MPLFVMHCLDKPDSLALRMATREAHLAYMAERKDVIRVGGPMLDAKGDMAGSFLILDLPDQAAAQALSDADPYTKAGLFAQRDIRELRATLGKL